MMNSWLDGLLILLTPLLATPAVLILYSPWVGMKAETISLIVTAFFATGHHLPGLIRAYGDRELFERFKWRFVLAPPLVFLAYFPLYAYHFDLYRLIILGWATWHGLMQLYGFVRIYDAKVGSTARMTAHWDWLICVCGFLMPQLFRPDKLAGVLNHWYASGGPHIPAAALSAGRWIFLGISAGAVVGFTVNYVVQSRSGTKPNPLKLLMLISGIGMWWFAMYFVENVLLGVALFDICHDVQYLAIVWLYNCRRVGTNPQLGRFMKYVFRRGMVLLYLGLITAYGAIGLVGSLVADGTISRLFFGILFTSTILHYYYDGFIWKVRESTNQAGLGLKQNGSSSPVRLAMGGGFPHLLKWSPAILGFAFLFSSDWLAPPLTKARTDELKQRYVQSLMGKTELPPTDAEKSWLLSQFLQAQDVAAAVPEDRISRLREAILLANFGRNDEALEKLDLIVDEHPDYADAHVIRGDIHLYRGNLDKAAKSFQSALSVARTPHERSQANLRLGEVDLRRNDHASAAAKFKAAVKDDPELATQIDAARQTTSAYDDVAMTKTGHLRRPPERIGRAVRWRVEVSKLEHAPRLVAEFARIPTIPGLVAEFARIPTISV